MSNNGGFLTVLQWDFLFNYNGQAVNDIYKRKKILSRSHILLRDSTSRNQKTLYRLFTA